MSTPATVPIFDPQGKVRDIPYEQMHDAISRGGKMGVYVADPSGTQRIVPADRVNEAVSKGGKVIPYNIDAGHQSEGFWKTYGKDIAGAVGGIAQTLASDPTGITAQGVGIGANVAANDIARQQRGSGKLYRATAALAQIATPANVVGMEEAADKGDTSGVLAHAAAGETMAAAPLLGEAGLKGAKAASKGVKAGVSGIKDAYATRATSAARATMPEVANLPPRAALGVEKIYRAAAPVGSDPGFRANLYKAAGDLAEIGRAAETELANAKGGIIQPDMRVRATVKAANEHLSDMYQTERAPQIARNADNPVQTNFSADAMDGLDYLAKKAGNSELRSLATKASEGEHMTLGEMDRLERLNSAELRNHNSMTPQDRAAVEATSPKIGALKPLDVELNQKIGQELSNRGEPGIKEYGQRYAAVSSVRDQLQSRMNAVELNQPGIVKRTVQPVAKLLTGGKTGVASASQAAVADVNIGRQLQQGLKHLAESGIKANRGVGTPVRPVKGLLGKGAIQLPSSMEPTTQPSTPQPVLERPYNPTGAKGTYDLPERTTVGKRTASDPYNPTGQRGRYDMPDVARRGKKGNLSQLLGLKRK